MSERFGRGAREDLEVGVERKSPDHRKQSVYFGEEMLSSLKQEAMRLDRSFSWVVQRCIALSLPQIKELPAMSDGGGESTTSSDAE